jgi:hypothetical protein
VAGLGAVPLGIALWRTQSALRAGVLLLIVALPVGLAGVIFVSAMGFVNIAGLPLTVLCRGAGIVLGGHLRSQGSATAEQPPRVI